MKCSKRTSKNRSSYQWTSIAAASVLAAALAGCGGGGGDGSGSFVPAPAAGAPGGGATAVAGAPPAPAAPAGTAPITLTATTAAAVFPTLAPTVTVGGVSIASPPIVTFAISDGAATNNPVIGFGFTNQPATATIPNLAHLRFSLAKLVPGTNGSPSKWVSYIVTNPPTYKSTTDKTIVAATPRGPTYDREGTLVDNKNGTYTYTFYRDITKMKDTVATLTDPAGSDHADLGDLAYDPTLPHRLTIEISGNARGTGTNTADGSNSGVTAVPLANPVNVIYDFIPATGKVLAAADLQREVVAIGNCNECHAKLAMHGAGKVDTRYCVMCHTDQLKYGQTNVASTAGKFPALTETATVSATTGITSYSYAPRMMVADGEVVGNFPIMVHKIHNGKELVKENYNLAGVVFDKKGYSMLGGGQKMCTKCHDNTKATNADNWNTKPSRVACGSCHDGIKWSDGTGSTLADKANFASAKVGAAVLATSGHVGKGQSSDSTCALCHSAADIKVYHQTENVTPHNPTVTSGLKNFTYEIASASVDATTYAVTVKFKISADGTPVTFVPAAATVTAPLSGFTSSPSFVMAYAKTQDGVTTPVDYNNLGLTNAQPATVSIADLLSTSKSATVGTLSGPDSSGYYTANIVGPTKVFPVGAKMRAVALQGYFVQVSPAASRHTISVVKAVTGDAVRRTVVDKTKCANCHEWFEGHGGNRVYETQVCVMCHVPGISTSGRQIPDATLNTWTFSNAQNALVSEWKTLFGFDKTAVNAALKLPVTTNNFKDMIHGIHAGRERVTPFVDARDSTSRGEVTLLDFRRMDFPGKLNNCETCHAAGTYSNVPANTLASTYEANNGAVVTPADVKLSLASTPNATDHVTTPFAAACVSCHNAASSQAHMKGNGGQILVDRSTLNLTGEACAVCHGAGKTADVSVVHKR